MAGRTAYGQGNAGMRSEPRGRMAAPGFDFAQAEADRAVAVGEPAFIPSPQTVTNIAYAGEPIPAPQKPDPVPFAGTVYEGTGGPRLPQPQTATYTSGGEYPATPATIMYDRSQSGIPISNEEFMAVSALSPRQSGFMPRPAFGGAMGGFSPYGFGRPPMGAGKGGYRPPVYGGFGMRPDRFRGGPMGGNVNLAGPPMMPPMYGQPQPFGGGRMAAPGYNLATGSFDNAGFGPVETATIVDPAPEPVMESGGIGSFGGANQPTNPYSMGYGMGFRQQQPMGGGKGGSAGGKGGAR